MNSKIDPEEVGEQLGMAGVGSMLEKIEAYCSQEVQRIELMNEPKIVALQAESTLLLQEEETLEHQIRNTPAPAAARNRPSRRVYTWGVVILLALSGFIFSVVAFDPFRLGWKSYLYCLGIAVVTPFLIHAVLERFNSARLIKSVVASGAVAAIASLVLLAVIRGDVLVQELGTVKAVVLLDDAPPIAPQHDFYGAALPLLRLVMALLAVAMELGAGLALEEAWRLEEESETNVEHTRKRLEAVRQRMLALVEEVVTLRNEPKVFAAQFWRNVYRSMLTHTARSAMTKLLVLVVAAGIGFLQAHATEEQTTIVVAVDLTQSVQSTGPDGKTNFQKNIEAVSTLLGKLPASTHIVVFGITDQSFAQPSLLLSARITDDPGHFGERLQAARAELIQLWKRRTAQLKPQSQSTDILGVLALAEQVFRESSEGRHLLIILSDMRHHTRALDLESGNLVRSFSARNNTALAPARLQNVEVYALGVDSAGKSQEYWESLKAFWIEYFRNAGATLRSYSVFRELKTIPQEITADR
jgi:hypothetical protein